MRKNSTRRFRRLSTEALECRRLLAVDVRQLANINQTNPWESAFLLTEVNGQAYFAARENAAGPALDLWVTDGTASGTTRLGTSIDSTREFANVGGVFYFRGDDAAHGRELWRSDGTVAGTTLVRDFTPGPDDSYVSDLVNLNGQLLFSNSGELSRSNGTAAGTFHVKDLWAGHSDEVDDITLVGSSTAYFVAKHAATGEALYKTDGTVAGTVLVEDAQDLEDLENVSGTLFFVKDGDLWKYSGTGASELVKSGGIPRELTNVGGTLFFSAEGGAILKSDGSAAGTVELGSAPRAFNLVNMNDRLYFTGGVELNGDGYELWTSDGTAGGTMMVKDIAPGSTYRVSYGYEGPEYIGPYGLSSNPGHFTNLNGTVFFLAGSGDQQLWTTDGTTAGTVQVQEGKFTSLLNRNGTLLMAGELPQTEGVNLYNSDGTLGDATPIPRSGPGTGSSNPSQVVDVNGTLFLIADDGIHGRELWKVESGVASLVKDIGPGLRSGYLDKLTNFQGKLYFTAYDAGFSHRLWMSDGTSAGTVEVREDLFVGVRGMAIVGDELFFSGTLADGEGEELWKTDGTGAGTMSVKDINPGSGSSTPMYLVNVNGTLFFSAFTTDGGQELWKSDGTEAGTVLVVDLNPGMESSGALKNSFPSNLTNFNGTLFFEATEPDTDYEGRALWKTDGTAEGTVLVKGLAQGLTVGSAAFTIVGDAMYFSGETGNEGQELWKTDGTTLGTMQVKEISPGAGSTTIHELTNVDGKLYFAIGSNGLLWRSDGSEAGTQPVAGAGMGVAGLTNLDGALFYSADIRDAADSSLGRELVEITNGGIVETYDLAPGPEGSDPGSLAVADGKLYFAASSFRGRELWRALSPAAPPNDAPVLDSSLDTTLIPTAEDTQNPVGTPIASVLDGITDQDADALRGIAVTYVNGAADGTWQYTLNNGATWLPIGAPTEHAALLLPNDPQAKVRFIPNANFTGQVQLNFRAWDQTEGTAGGTFDLVGHYGGRHAFSRAYEISRLTVTPVNDAPLLDDALSPTLGRIKEDTKFPAATPVWSLLKGAVSDVDAGAQRGMAVTSASNFHGAWQFRLSDGLWQAMGDVTSAAALLLPSDAQVRFIPKPDFHGAVKLFYRAWDRTAGTAGETLPVQGNTGGIKSMSTAYDSASLVVKSVQEAPVLDLNVSSVAYQRAAPAITLAPAATFNDVDSDNFEGGRLRVRITEGMGFHDRLLIGAAFTLGTSKSVVLNGTRIGTRAENGWGPDGLIVTLNSNATKAVVQKLIRSINFDTVGGPPAQRKIVFTVSDGDGGLSNEGVLRVNVS